MDWNICWKIVVPRYIGRASAILLPRWLSIKCQERYLISWGVLFLSNLVLVVVGVVRTD